MMSALTNTYRDDCIKLTWLNPQQIQKRTS
jgi:hypothetical protein